MSETQFHIKAPGINTAELKVAIEEIISREKISDAEIQRIDEMDFKPVSPAQEYAFNPPVTCELFERRVEPPDFSSRKYGYVIGPLRWLAKKIYSHLSLLYERSSRNKTQAFYNIVHELIYLRSRIEWLETNQFNPGNKTDAASDQKIRPDLPHFQEISDRIFSSYGDIFNSRLLILDDPELIYVKNAKKNGFQFISANCIDEKLSAQIKDLNGIVLEQGSCENLLLKNNPDMFSGCIIADLGNYSGIIENLYKNLDLTIKQDGIVHMIFMAGLANSGFSWINRFQLDQDLVIKNMKTNGFTLVESISPVTLDNQSFVLQFKKQ